MKYIVSIILPTYNEEKALQKVVKDIVDNFPEYGEIIIVNDGSTDKTESVAKLCEKRYKNVRLISHEKNKGKVEAIRTGVKNARGSIIVLMDSDYTYPAEYIRYLVEKIKDGYDLVLGNRFGKKYKMSLFNKIGNKIFSLLITFFSGKSIADGQTGFRAFRKSIFPEIDVRAKSLEYETKQTLKAARLGYKIYEVPIEYRKRIGKSKLNPVIDGFKMFKAIVDIFWDESILASKLFIVLSIILSFIGFMFGLIVLREKILYGILAHEYYPLLSTLLIFIGIQMFSLGVILDILTKRLDRIEEMLSKKS